MMLEDLLVRDFNITPEQILIYKQTQIDSLNNFFMQAFMDTDIRDYFTELLNSTSYCVAVLMLLNFYWDLLIGINSAPQSDKPAERM